MPVRTPGTDRAAGRALPSRRAVVRAAAWSAPVVAAAAAVPAYAASPCPTATVTWSSFASGTTLASGSTNTFGGVGVTLTYVGATGAPNNAKVFTATQTGGVSSALRFYDVNASSTLQTITFSFNFAVKNLSFSILDVDSITNSFSDQVQVVTSGYSFTLGGTVQGDGTVGNLFRPTTANTSVPGTSGTGNVNLLWANPVTSVQFVYSQYAGTVAGSPFIGISDMSFQAIAC